MGIKIKSKLIICLFISFTVCADYSIKTESGITDGKLKNKVIYWYDIPYAQPPVGDLR
jgi:Carboxylesterase type B